MVPVLTAALLSCASISSLIAPVVVPGEPAICKHYFCIYVYSLPTHNREGELFLAQVQLKANVI